MAVPWIVYPIAILLIGFGGGVVTHSVVTDQPLDQTTDELVCNLTGTFEQFNDADCPQYQISNDPPPEVNSTQSILDLNTWSPLQLSIGFGLLFAVLFQRRR